MLKFYIKLYSRLHLIDFHRHILHRLPRSHQDRLSNKLKGKCLYNWILVQFGNQKNSRLLIQSCHPHIHFQVWFHHHKDKNIFKEFQNIRTLFLFSRLNYIRRLKLSSHRHKLHRLFCNRLHRLLNKYLEIQYITNDLQLDKNRNRLHLQDYYLHRSLQDHKLHLHRESNIHH